MGVFERAFGKGSKKKKALRVAAKVRHAARKIPEVSKYAPAFGSEKRSVIGTKLSSAQQKTLRKEKAKSRKKTKKMIKRIWRKII